MYSTSIINSFSQQTQEWCQVVFASKFVDHWAKQKKYIMYCILVCFLVNKLFKIRVGW